ncbi:zinc finger, CCHC-type containing protein [Tanacetum coccineum]
MAGNTVKEMTTNFGKLDKFEGHDFRRWQKKMHFLLTTLKVVYVLTTPMPELLEDATVEAIRIRAKWENDDYICRGHILNGMSDSLFDVYTNVESAKELWDSLESKYMAEDSSSKKFLVSNFNNYKMVDSRPVMEQYNELLRILGQYTQHGLKMDESISVSSIIDKLPPSWKDFKHTLKHGKDDLSLVQLGSHLRIEESLRAQDSDKGKGKEVAGPSVNMTEEGKNKNNKQNKGKKRDFKEHGSGSGSNKKPKLECWKCGKTGHFKRDCRSGNKKNANAGGSGKGSKDRSQDQGQNLVPVWNRFIKYSVSLISEAFYVQVDAIAWWIDSGATTHVCKDRCWFKTYEPVEDGSVLYMGDDHFAPVHGKGSVVLEFSSVINSYVNIFRCIMFSSTTKFKFATRRKSFKAPMVMESRAYTNQSHDVLEPRATPSIFLGYALSHRGYRCLDLTTNKIILSRHVTFDETIFSYGSTKPALVPSYTFLDKPDIPTSSVSVSKPPTTVTVTPNQTIPTNDEAQLPSPTTPSYHTPNNDAAQISPPVAHSPNVPSMPQSPINHTVVSPNSPTTTGTAQQTPTHVTSQSTSAQSVPNITHPVIILDSPVNPNPTSIHPMVTRFRVGSNKPTQRLNFHVLSVSPLPKTYRDALHDSNWQNAMRDKYDALIKNSTWTLVSRPPDANVVHCMWLFRHKFLADGTLSRYKAQLVANGSTQLEGVNVDETFSPVVKPGTIHGLYASTSWVLGFYTS